MEKELKKYSVPNPFKRTGKWQMLFVSEDGKTIAIKRYREFVITVVVVLALSLGFSAFFSMMYFKSRDQNKELRVSLVSVENERKHLQDEKEHLQAQLFIPKKKLETAEPKVKAEKKADDAPKPTPKKETKKAEKMTADVKDLTFSKNEGDSETRIRFIVKNTCKLDAIAGRVFVILRPDSNNSQDWLTMPPVTLKDGIPSMPSMGQFFSINHFKSVKFKFNNPFPDDHYKKMDVYIFSTDGDKIYENTFDVDLDVIKKPKADPPDKGSAENNDKTSVSVPPNESHGKPGLPLGSEPKPMAKEGVTVVTTDRAIPVGDNPATDPGSDSPEGASDGEKPNED